MEIGNLVKVAIRHAPIGVIVNRYKNHKNKLLSVDVLLGNGEIMNVGPRACKVINEGR